jgi:hypothetical protein
MLETYRIAGCLSSRGELKSCLKEDSNLKHPVSGPQSQLRGPETGNQQGNLRSKRIATGKTFVALPLLAAVTFI